MNDYVLGKPLTQAFEESLRGLHDDGGWYLVDAYLWDSMWCGGSIFLWNDFRASRGVEVAISIERAIDDLRTG